MQPTREQLIAEVKRLRKLVVERETLCAHLQKEIEQLKHHGNMARASWQRELEEAKKEAGLK